MNSYNLAMGAVNMPELLYFIWTINTACNVHIKILANKSN